MSAVRGDIVRLAESRQVRDFAVSTPASLAVLAPEGEHPRARYIVPGRARPLIALLTSLPVRLADRVKHRALATP